MLLFVTLSVPCREPLLLARFETKAERSCQPFPTWSQQCKCTGSQSGTGKARRPQHSTVARALGFSASPIFHGCNTPTFRPQPDARTAPWPIESGSSSIQCIFKRLFWGGTDGDGSSPALFNVPDPEAEAERWTTNFRDDVPVPFPPSLLDGTFLAGKTLKCCYRASEDGFGARAFHQLADFKGPSVVVCRTDKGVRFGAFSPRGFRSTDDYYDSFEAFLFYWPDSSSDLESVVKLEKVGGSGAAQFDYTRGGPMFGADALVIGPPLAPVMGGFSGPEASSGVGDLKEARSKLGNSYARRPDGKDSVFGNDRSAKLVEIEVFASPEIAAMY